MRPYTIFDYLDAAAAAVPFSARRTRGRAALAGDTLCVVALSPAAAADGSIDYGPRMIDIQPMTRRLVATHRSLSSLAQRLTVSLLFIWFFL